MAETSSTTDAVIDAALALAARRPWQDVGLADIAAEAGLDLAGLRQVAASKAHILALFSRRVDTLLLKALKDETQEGEAHDRLFDVIMRRLEILQPWRAAVKSIVAAGPGDPLAVASAGLNAMDGQRWTMAAAGVDLPRDGIAQGVRLAGLAAGAAPGAAGVGRRRRSGTCPHHGGARQKLARRRHLAEAP